jgi:hypothetical protein
MTAKGQRPAGLPAPLAARSRSGEAAVTGARQSGFMEGRSSRADRTRRVSPAHNGGPALDDPPDHVPEWGEDGGAAEYFQWKAALRRSRKGVPHDIVMFRLSRAEAAGVDYETYVTALLERGCRLQTGDDPEALKARWKTRTRVTVKPL